MEVYLEVGAKRTFACALAWPGWARSGRDEAGALEALELYAVRYLSVARRTGLAVDWEPGRLGFEVVERVPGTMTTDFGAIDVVLERDHRPTTAQDGDWLAACVDAAWTELDEIAAVTSSRLRKGPRGGGRDRDAVLDHVLGAEQSYIRKVGVAHRQPGREDRAAIEAMRRDTLTALRAPWDGRQLGLGRGKSWPPRYAARRIAWHVLDHAWEMQDKDLRSETDLTQETGIVGQRNAP